MPRTPLIAANWKMNTTIAEAGELAGALLPQIDPVAEVEKLLCPPFVSVATVAEVVKGTSVKMGAQNMHHEARGAFTGEISPVMLQGVCEYVIIGHSERRIHFGEKDFNINLKVQAALKHNLKPVLCVGEDMDQREGGEAGAVVSHQLETAFRAVVFSPDIVIAYEPVWSIGTGAPAQPDEAEEMAALIRRWLAGRFTGLPVDATRILYGGSVAAHNVASFIAMPNVDGALVGSASLRADEFLAIVKNSAEAAKAK